jgi:hypothetical protein
MRLQILYFSVFTLDVFQLLLYIMGVLPGIKFREVSRISGLFSCALFIEVSFSAVTPVFMGVEREGIFLLLDKFLTGPDGSLDAAE